MYTVLSIQIVLVSVLFLSLEGEGRSEGIVSLRESIQVLADLYPPLLLLLVSALPLLEKALEGVFYIVAIGMAVSPIRLWSSF